MLGESKEENITEIRRYSRRNIGVSMGADTTYGRDISPVNARSTQAANGQNEAFFFLLLGGFEPPTKGFHFRPSSTRANMPFDKYYTLKIYISKLRI